LPGLLTAANRDYPDLELDVRETQTDVLVRALIDGTLDVLLLALPIIAPDVTTRALFEDKFLLAASQDRILPKRVKVSSDVFQKETLLLLEEGHCLRDQALSFCELIPQQGLGALGASSLTTLVEMVANDMGVTLLPQVSAAAEMRRGGIKLVPFTAPSPSRTIGLAWRHRSPRAPDFEALADLVMAARPEPATSK